MLMALVLAPVSLFEWKMYVVGEGISLGMESRPYSLPLLLLKPLNLTVYNEYPCSVVLPGRPPSKAEIEKLEKRCDGTPVKFCQVDHGHITFLSFDRVELPILP